MPGVAEHLATCESCAAHLAVQRALAAELGAPPPSLAVPPAQDAALRAAARGRAAEIAVAVAPSRSRWAWMAAAGAAVAVAAALLLLFGRGGSPDSTTPRIAVAPIHGDINRDGQLDVIDALVLARQLDSARPNPDNDVNGDGSVDHSDVEWISAAVVSVRRTP